MPEPSLNDKSAVAMHKFVMNAILFGPVQPDQNLHRQTQRALKSHSEGRDFFTDITLHESRQNGSMRVEYTVTASSPSSAERAGAVYLSQLCDLVSAITRSPIRFFLPDEDSRDERIRANQRATALDRVLTEEEWLWITGTLVFLRRDHPRYLAAASWYRKGLTGGDVLDTFCCFWRVIERLALSYADKTKLENKGQAKACVVQLAADLFVVGDAPEALADEKRIAEVVELRNNLSHGNIPITGEVIDQAHSQLKVLEEAAFEVLDRIRRSRVAATTVA